MAKTVAAQPIKLRPGWGPGCTTTIVELDLFLTEGRGQGVDRGFTIATLRLVEPVVEQDDRPGMSPRDGPVGYLLRGHAVPVAGSVVPGHGHQGVLTEESHQPGGADSLRRPEQPRIDTGGVVDGVLRSSQIQALAARVL